MLFVPVDALAQSNSAEGPIAVDVPGDVDLSPLHKRLERIAVIRIAFPSPADGRRFSIARQPNEHWRQSIAEKDNATRTGYRKTLTFNAAQTMPDSTQKPASDATAGQPSRPLQANIYAETVTQVTHYTDTLFSFRMTRPRSFRFRSGEFVMIGLPDFEKPIYRAYSIASPSWDEELEFYSIKVPDGPLTEHLQKISVGDTVLMRKKSTGTLVNDALIPGKRLFMFSTGTGIAPFASLIRDPETYEKFDQVILTQTCRQVAELSYGNATVALAKNDPLVGEEVSQQLTHRALTTREESPYMGRITHLIESGKLFADLGISPLDPETDRAMICGSMEMVQDTKTLLEGLGAREGSNANPGAFVLERAFVD